MEYQLGVVKVVVFIAKDTTSEGYSHLRDGQGGWVGFIVEDNGPIILKFQCKSESIAKCSEMCKRRFEELYPNVKWLEDA